MQLPKYSPNAGKRRLEKLCLYPGCGKPFLGRHQSKYCNFHMEAKHRHRPRNTNLVTGNNVEIPHKYIDVTEILRLCDTCKHDYVVALYPRVHTYPAHCEKHRTEHQRKEYVRRHKPMEAVNG
jgi:hypothetical protein